MLKYMLPVVFVLVLAVVAPGTLAAEQVPSSTLVPPALQALEQKMLLIHFNTARVSGVFALGDLGAPSVDGTELGANANKCKSLTISTQATVRLSPSGVVASSEIDGTALTRLIGIGKTLYTYTPSAKRYDGGRPWVRSSQVPSKSSTGLSGVLSTLAEDQPATSTDMFKTLIEEVNGASSIQEDGQSTVDGQEVTEYTATISMASILAERLSPKQIEAAKRKDKTFKRFAEATVALELFITPSGMPLRTIDVIGPRSEGLGVEQDILATGVPLATHAPPARLTIGQARLRKLEKRRARTLRPGEAPPAGPLGSLPSRCPSEPSEGKETESSGKRHRGKLLSTMASMSRVD